MTQITPDQRQLEATSGRALAKFRDFYTALPVDERAMLAATLRQYRPGAGERADDTTGSAMHPAVAFGLGYLATKVLDGIFDGDKHPNADKALGLLASGDMKGAMQVLQ